MCKRMAEALASGERDQIGRLCEQGFVGARDDYEIVVPAMEAMVEALAGPGCVGARQAGAGFGGCLVAGVERGAVAEGMARAARRFAATWGADGAFFEVHSADGAGRSTSDASPSHLLYASVSSSLVTCASAAPMNRP